MNITTYVHIALNVNKTATYVNEAEYMDTIGAT
jgi:hypothetical protein